MFSPLSDREKLQERLAKLAGGASHVLVALVQDQVHGGERDIADRDQHAC